MLSVVLVGLFVYITYLIINQYTYWRRKGILHVNSYPLIGNEALHFFRIIPTPLLSLKLYNQHPGAAWYGVFHFSQPGIVIKDPEILKDVTIKHFDSFVDRNFFLTKEMDPIIGYFLLSQKGEFWKTSRHLLSPNFTGARMKAMFPHIVDCTRNFIDYYTKNPQVAKEFQAKDAFSTYMNDTIASLAFGIEVQSSKSRENEFYKHAKAATAFNTRWVIKLIIMSLVPFITRNLGVTILPNKSQKYLTKVIEENVKVRKEKNIIRHDMLHLIIQDIGKNDNDYDASVKHMQGQAINFFIAGFETTSSTMMFMLHELANHPDIHERLQKEIDDYMEANNGKITFESLKNLKYIDMVMNEALRMYAPSPIVNRACTKDFMLPPCKEGYPGYLLKKGEFVTIPIRGFHHNPEFFPNPEKFDPERFSDENKKNINPYAFLPFGIGPRDCIGRRFAIILVKVGIISILTKFNVKPTPKTKRNVEYRSNTVTTFSKDGCWVGLEERVKAAA